MGQTCCGLDNQIEDIILQVEYEKVEFNEVNFQLLGLSIGQSELSKENNLSVWKKKDQDKYYCGNWKDGYADGEQSTFVSDVLSYRGSFVKGMPQGMGRLSFKKRDEVYEGEFVEGKAHGRGKIINSKEGIQLQGNWFCSNPISGAITFKDEQALIESISISDFQSNQVEINFKSKDHFKGQVDEKLKPNGQGILIYSPNSSMESYQGDWEQGVFHGKGKAIWKDGSCYIGCYSNGKKQGDGKFIFKSGRYYEGHWLGGQKNGRGIVSDKDGTALKQGIWLNGNFVMELPKQEMNNIESKD